MAKVRPDFFLKFGFTVEYWEIMAAAFINHAADHELAKIETSPFGTRYVIEGKLITPDGRNPEVRSVWFMATGDDNPRLVSAYPLE